MPNNENVLNRVYVKWFNHEAYETNKIYKNTVSLKTVYEILIAVIETWTGCSKSGILSWATQGYFVQRF